MANSDVWKDISSYIEVYTSVTFDKVPVVPGVYAWFYPITPPSKNIEDLEVELSTILNYDSKLEGEKRGKGNIEFNWKNLEVNVSEEPKKDFPDIAKQQWDEFKQDNNIYRDLQKIMYVASILMPPLYIGKTNNLRVRCRQHRTSTNEEKNSFRNRFETFTKDKLLKNDKNFRYRRVEDLIFVCIRTDTLGGIENSGTNSEVLLEEIFKLLANPPYGKY